MTFTPGWPFDGTRCGDDKRCYRGSCYEIEFLNQITNVDDEDEDEDEEEGPEPEPSWTDWQTSSCRANCLTGSTGTQVKYRSCLLPDGEQSDRCLVS